MNTKRNWRSKWLLLGTVVLLGWPGEADAFYDPAPQRWINRDPFEDYGFQELSDQHGKQRTDGNLYVFLDNNPLLKNDTWGLSPTLKGCRKRQEDAIKQALKQQCDNAKRCAKCTPAGEAQVGVNAVCDGNNVTINCVADDFVFSDKSTCKTRCGAARGNEIFLCDKAFTAPGCSGVGCTIFHESLHVGGLPGSRKAPHPFDFGIFQKCMGCNGPSY
jgi:hypothetical protein